MFEADKRNGLKKVELLYHCDRAKDCNTSISCNNMMCSRTFHREHSRNWKHREPTMQEIFNRFEYIDENEETIFMGERIQ